MSFLSPNLSVTDATMQQRSDPAEKNLITASIPFLRVGAVNKKIVTTELRLEMTTSRDGFITNASRKFLFAPVYICSGLDKLFLLTTCSLKNELSTPFFHYQRQIVTVAKS